MIYLLHDEIIEHKFNENEKQVFIDFKLKPINIWNDEIFQIDYLIDLFYDFNFYYSCVVQKNQFIIKKINSTKNKVLNQIKFSNEKTLIENINQVINEQKITELYIHSNHNLIKALINGKNKKYICFETGT